MQLTLSFVVLLQEFRYVFTSPSFETFRALMQGWCLSFRHRFITELIQASGSTHAGHHSCYHRFFSDAAWDIDFLWRILAKVLILTFAATGLIELAVDDTLCRKRGLTIYGTGMHHDPLLSSRALKCFSWGHDWLVLCLVVRRPWAPSKVWCLPLLCRLYRNRQGLTKGRKPKGQKVKGQKARARQRGAVDTSHRSRPELARELIALVAAWFPDRQLLVSGDSAYGGGSVLQHVPANVDVLSRVAPNGVLYAPPPVPTPETKTRGRRRREGARLPSKEA